jgi:hypothetical protein
MSENLFGTEQCTLMVSSRINIGISSFTRYFKQNKKSNLEVFTFMAVNSNNKRQNYDNSWNHIEICNKKWCYMTTHQDCNNSNTTGEVVEQELLSRPEFVSSPLSMCMLRFRLNTIFGSSFHLIVLDFFFGSSYFFKCYLYLLLSYMISM